MTTIAKSKHDLFIWVGVLLLLVGFAPTFYLKPVFGAGKSLTLLVFAHGVATTAWIAMFVYQYYTANRGSLARHKFFGVLGAVLFGLIVPLSLVTVVARVAVMDPTVSGIAPLTGMAYPFWVLVEFSIFGIAAFATTRRLEWHRNFQMAATFALLAPAIIRALRFVAVTGLGATFGSLLLSLLLYLGATNLKDARTGKLSRAVLVVVGVDLLAAILLFLSLKGAPLWLQFASALTGRPL